MKRIGYLIGLAADLTYAVLMVAAGAVLIVAGATGNVWLR